MTARDLLAHVVTLGARVWLDGERVRVIAARGVLNEELWAELTRHKNALREMLEAQHAKQNARPVLEATHRPASIPLSYAQRRLWFIDQLEGASAQYNIPEALRLRGPLDVKALDRAVQCLVERHEPLRTHFAEIDGEPTQVIVEKLKIEIPLEDLSGFDDDAQHASVTAAQQREWREPFDLSRGPVLRVRVLKLAENDHILLQTFHHIVSDGWSVGVLHRELALLYASFREGRSNPLAPLAVQYADFAMWQQRWLSEEALRGPLGYWTRQLADIPEQLLLPTDRPRPALPVWDAGSFRSLIPVDRVTRLQTMGRASGCTLYMTLLAAFAVLLERCSGQDDVVVGSPVANRLDTNLEAMVGFFVNPLVMRVRVAEDKSFRQLLTEVRKTTLDAYEHQDVPFEKIVDELAPERSLSHTPVFQVSFALQNAPMPPQILEGLAVEPMSDEHLRVRFDLELHGYEQDGVVVLYWMYKRDLFDEGRMQQMADHFGTLLEAVAGSPDTPIRLLAMTGTEERRRLLEMSAGEVRGSKPFLLRDAFEAQVRRTPQATAVIFEQESLTYAELNQRVDLLALALTTRGIGPETLVGICLPRSIEMLVAVLAVMKARAAYVPLDPAYPPARLQSMADDAGVALVLVSREANFAALTLRVDLPMEALAAAAIAVSPSPGNLAYVLYTSGSTGKPKGVAVTYAQLSSYVAWAMERYEAGSGEGAPVNTPLAFDATITSLYAPLLAGRPVILLHEDRQLEELASWLASGTELTLVKLTPAHLEALRDLMGEKVSRIRARFFVVGGEVLHGSVAAFWRTHAPAVRIINEYGPTEATVGCAVYEVGEAIKEDVPIGSPIPNTRIYVLDGNLEPTPLGITGELYLAGAGLARGYLHRSALTSERFVADPYGGTGERMYRTGDLGARRADGTLEFLGRADSQLKVRGFRIEPGEIEAELRRHPQVRSAMVLAESKDDVKQLVGYVVAEPKPSAERRGAQLARWRELYETNYQAPSGDANFDIAGWNSSYTGEAIPEQEMRAWVEETVERIRALKPRRVLEIGCGTGLLLQRLAPQCQAYTGIDLSAGVLEHLQTHLLAKGGFDHVTLRHGLAHELAFVADGSVDVVVLNSVAQYFPDLGYLEEVVAQAVRVIAKGGSLFLGDIRNLNLLEPYHVSVQLHKASGEMKLETIQQNVLRAMQNEEELVIAPQWVENLPHRFDAVGGTELFLKTGAYDNELSRFRYDAVVRIGSKEHVADPEVWLDWREDETWWALLEALLADVPDASVGVRGIRDRLVAYASEASRILRGSSGLSNAAQLRASLLRVSGQDRTLLLAHAQRLGVSITCTHLREDGTYRAIFRPRWVQALAAAPNERTTFANEPSRAASDAELAWDLQDRLTAALPAYMVPAGIVVLRSWPLTVNGKVDRHALPALGRNGLVSAAYVEPISETAKLLAGMWAEILRIDRAGEEDDFFALGGHSLMATQVMSRVRELFGVSLTVRTLFDHPRLGPLANSIDEARKASHDARPALRVMPRPERIPLSYAQRRLWFIDQLEGGSREYNIPEALRLRGDLDHAALQQAIDGVVARHESLRTHFAEVDGEPVQVIVPAFSVAIAHEDLSGFSKCEQQERVDSAVRAEYEQAFDLWRGPLLRMRLLRLAAGDHILLLTLHHIVSDGWSAGIVSRELGVLYDVFKRGAANPLPALPVQYADFSLWQRDWLEGGALERGLSYWKQQLDGIPAQLELATDHPRPSIQTYTAAVAYARFTPEQLVRLRRLGQESRATLYMTLLAGFAALLDRYSGGQGDIVVGSPIANRQEPQLEEMIGFFVNSLVMRVKVRHEASFRDLLAEVRRTTLDAYQHQDIPFERLVEELAPERSLKGTPLFQVMFALQNAPRGTHRFEGLEIAPVEARELRVRFDLEAHCVENDGGLDLVWMYNRDLFDAERIDRMIATFMRLLETAKAEPDMPLRRLHQKESDHQPSRILPAPNETIVERFEKQAADHPEAEAVVFEDGILSYGQLNAKANGWACALQERGVRRGDLVGLSMERGPEMVIGMLGILKSGAAYLPLDPDYPTQRLRAMLTDSRASYLIAGREIPEFVPPKVTCLHAEEGWSEENPVSATVPEDLAYVMYTSGSTGTPKGVAIPHRGVVRLVCGTDYLEVERGDRIAQLASMSFDASTFEVWAALLNGGTVVILPQDTVLSPGSLVRALHMQRIDTIFLTTALFHQTASTVPGAFSGLRNVLFGGESADPAALRNLLKHKPPQRLLNVYGPTENTSFRTWHLITTAGERDETVPIGLPIAYSDAFLLDADLNPAPAGVVGELYVSGAGLAWGYHRRPGLTAERFLANPHAHQPGSLMYRTGDLARWRSSGEIEFVGRADQQVKIRGHRIELGEIEMALRAHESVADALVTVHRQAGEKQLLAYVIARHREEQKSTAQEGHVTHWHELYETVYAEGAPENGGFDIAGWLSSYTGASIAPEEMRIWVDETVTKLRAFRAKDIVEVGCGTGLLLTRLAVDCTTYTGLDFSQAALDKVGRYLTTRPDLAHVELRSGLAHDLSFLPDDSVDLVVLNSIVQYFPSTAYLLDVLEEAVRVTRAGGHIFVGDVRSFPLCAAYHASVQMYKAEPGTPLSELKQRVLHAQQIDKELLLDPRLFFQFGLRSTQTGRVDIALKGGSYENELSRFRYDATISLGTKETLRKPEQEVIWDEAGGWREAVTSALSKQPGQSVSLRGIRDQRIAAAVRAASLLITGYGELEDVADLRATCAEAGGEDPEAVISVARGLGVEIAWRGFKSDGIYEAIFRPGWQANSSAESLERTAFSQFTNDPARSSVDVELGRTLQASLCYTLPKYMVPSMVVVLPSWPLSRNGKLDRAALPVPGRAGRVADAYEEPRGEIELALASIWQGLLGLDQVGRKDNFFSLGGHSLLATQVMSRVRDAFGVELRVRSLFNAPRLAELAREIEEARGDLGAKKPVLEAQERPTAIPLSYAQQRLWFIDQLQASSGEYNMPHALCLRGKLNRAALERVLQTIVDRHESLRTRFEEVDGQPIQVIEEGLRVQTVFEDLTGLEEEVRRAAVEERMAHESSQSFDLRYGPLVRFRLLKTEAEEHVLLRTCHHIASDGWSEAVFNREFEQLYAAYNEGLDNPLEPLPVQYADFTLWQRQCLEGEGLSKGLAYWKAELDGIATLDLPMDRPRPAQPSYAADVFAMSVPHELADALKELSGQQSASLYMTLLTGFAVLLERYTGQQDIVIGTPIANRQDSQLERLIGMFVNTLVMRVKVSGQETFRELLTAVRHTTLNAYQHQDVPFERLVEELAPERSLNTTPVFQISFAMQNAPVIEGRLKGLSIESLALEERKVRYDLELHCMEVEGTLRIFWLYKKALFDAWRIEQMAGHYLGVLADVVATPDELTSGCALLSPSQTGLLLHGFQGDETGSSPETVVELFEECVEQFADRVALVFERESVTYRDLNARANRLAHALLDRGAQAEALVGICMERSVAMVVSMLAILKTGAAFVPLDPEYPAERLRRMLHGVSMIVTSQALRPGMRGATTVVVPEELSQTLSEDNPTTIDRGCSLHAGRTAYVIYTSGSTGVPKGVVVGHDALANHMQWMREAYPVAPDDRVLARTSINFDASLWELLLPLLSGARLCLVGTEISRDPVALHEYIDRAEVTIAQFVPTLLEALLDAGRSKPRSLRMVFSGGEALSAKLAQHVVLGWKLPIVNLFGPTETTIQVTHHGCEEAPDEGEVAIGRPILNTRVWVLDAHLRLLPVGAVGELYIAGASLARGYLDQPALTAERFVANPFEVGLRMYRTGDLARWSPDGLLEFCGRADSQVKLRGFRVELGEVEAALKAQPSITAAAAGLHTQSTGSDGVERTQLVAWVVPAAGESIEIDELRRALSERLPQHFIPSSFVILPALPLSPNGKLDRRKLPDPERPAKELRLASTREEEMISAIFAEVLSLREVGVDENFFALGGHSLLATRVVTRVRAALAADISIRTMWESPTVAGLAAKIAADHAAAPIVYANTKTVVRRKTAHV